MDAPPGPDAPLPDDVATLQGMVRQLLGELRTLRAENADLKTKLDAALTHRFGRRSEHRTRVPKTEPGESRPRDPHGRAELPAHLERREVVHDLSEAERLCPCCGRVRACIGQQSAEQLDCEPARFFVRRTTRKSYACRHCDPETVPPEQRLRTAGPNTVGPIPKGLCGPGLLASVLTAKFADHVPLNRQLGIIARSGVTVCAATLCDWVRQAAELLTPLCAWMHRRVLAAPVLWSDDTRVRYQVPGRKTTARGHLWVAVGDASAPYATFHFTRDYTAAAGPDRFLKDYRGFVHADCLAQYDPLFEAGARHVACWAHARRKLLDAGDAARPAVELVGRLYAVERNLPPPDTPEHLAERATRRRSESEPILTQLGAWLRAASAAALPKSPLGRAAGYILPRWAAFTRYTTDGRLSIDNNLGERTLRRVAVGRGNWTFLGSAASGGWAATHYTVVGTCRHLGIDPFAYLRDVLVRLHDLGDRPTAEQLTPLLPDRWLDARSTSSTAAA
jgi:transposase